MLLLDTFGAELLQQVATFDLASWLRNLYHELRTGLKEVKLHLRSDCMGVVQVVAFSLRQQARERRLTPDLWVIREAIATSSITSLEHVPTKSMVADGLTKYGCKPAQAIKRAMRGLILYPLTTPEAAINKKKPVRGSKHRPHESMIRREEDGTDVKASGPLEGRVRDDGL